MLIIDKVTKEMKDSTNQKFLEWDRVVKEDLYEEGSVEDKRYVLDLLKDPTIYMYAFFRDPSDMSNPLKLYPYQDIIINDMHKRIVFAASNQIGKSITLCCKALHYALTTPGKTVIMVSRTLPQSKDLLRQIKTLLQTSKMPFEDNIGDSYNKTEIYFKHHRFVMEDGEEVRLDLPQSRIICIPATPAILGYAAHMLLLDEIAFYEDGTDFYYQMAQPRTYTTKGQIVAFSNPNGAMGILWEFWNDIDFHKYTFNFLDKPGNTQEEYDALRRKLTREKFDSTVNAVFTDPEGGFITWRERKDMIDDNLTNRLPTMFTTPIHVFFDFAKVRDRTVRTIGIPIYGSDEEWGQQVLVYEMKEYPSGTPYTEIIEDLRDLINMVGQINVASVGWDDSGVGGGIADFIKRIEEIGIPAMPVSFNLQNKSRIYMLFKLLIENRRIKIPYVAECDKQLSTLRFKKIEGSSNWKVHHQEESDRDDFPDALAGLCSLIVQPENPPVTAVIIGEDTVNEDTTKLSGFIEHEGGF